jgi:serine/threonine-protein kinase
MGSLPALDVDTLLEGTPYLAMARLSEGGMGEIYEAVDREGGGRVVVKLLRAELCKQPEMIDRMRVEGEALALLSHPNIVGARGHGLTREGRPYVAMERVVGCTLKEELRRRGAMRLADAVAYTTQVLSALEAVHRAGIVHRDVKPENIVVSRDGGRGRELKLLDFGVAKVEPSRHLRIAPLAIPTTEGACIGTPRYAAPEQARGDVVDKRADIYGAGILLYTMIAGRGPFDDVKGPGRVAQAHMSEPPPPPSQFAPFPVPPAIEAIVMRAIAKEASDRFADAASFRRELARAMASVREPVGREDHLESGSTPTQIFVRPGSEAPTVVAPRFDLLPTVVAPAAGPSPAVSRVEVLLSAAAFATLAGALAMWFVH